jgi:hypothetical protein
VDGGVKVSLDQSERNLVLIVAQARRNIARQVFTWHWTNTLRAQMIGAGGELAFCKLTHRPWRPTVGYAGMRSLADVEPNFEIKTTTDPRYGVRVKIYGDMHKRFALNYVLVRYLGNTDFELVGWIPGSLVPLVGFIQHFKSKGPACYLVEPEALKPVEELIQ